MASGSGFGRQAPRARRPEPLKSNAIRLKLVKNPGPDRDASGKFCVCPQTETVHETAMKQSRCLRWQDARAECLRVVVVSMFRS